MRNIKPVVLILLLLIGLTLTGCSDSPPYAVIEEGILKKVGKGQEVKNIVIVDEKMTDYGNEKFWIVNFEAVVVYSDAVAKAKGRTEEKIKDTIRLSQQGKTWFHARQGR